MLFPSERVNIFNQFRSKSYFLSPKNNPHDPYSRLFQHGIGGLAFVAVSLVNNNDDAFFPRDILETFGG